MRKHLADLCQVRCVVSRLGLSHHSFTFNSTLAHLADPYQVCCGLVFRDQCQGPVLCHQTTVPCSFAAACDVRRGVHQPCSAQSARWKLQEVRPQQVHAVACIVQDRSGVLLAGNLNNSMAANE